MNPVTVGCNTLQLRQLVRSFKVLVCRCLHMQTTLTCASMHAELLCTQYYTHMHITFHIRTQELAVGQILLKIVCITQRGCTRNVTNTIVLEIPSKNLVYQSFSIFFFLVCVLKLLFNLVNQTHHHTG